MLKGTLWALVPTALKMTSYGNLQITGKGTTSETLFVVQVSLTQGKVSYSSGLFFDYLANYPVSCLG